MRGGCAAGAAGAAGRGAAGGEGLVVAEGLEVRGAEGEGGVRDGGGWGA